MAKRSTRTQELKEKTELNCMWGLYSIIESCQGRPSRKLISNGRPVNKHIVEYPRKLDQLASFDEECRRIQNEAGIRSASADARASDAGSFVQENMPMDKHKSKQNLIKRQEHGKLDSELDRLVKIQKRERKSSQKAYQSSLCRLNNEASLIHQLPSAGMSLNRLTLAAILEAVSAQNHQEESELSEYFQRSSHLGRCDRVEEISIQQVQMRAKAFVDQMFIDRKFIRKEGTSSASKSFSDALEVLHSKKDLFLEFLPDRNYLPTTGIKSSHTSQTGKDSVESVVDANSSESEGLNASRTSSTAKPSDKIVILKPAPQNAKHSENVTCHCSSLQSHNKLGRRVSDTKTTSFSFREMRKKLKHTFRVTKKEPSKFIMLATSDKLSRQKSTGDVGDGCTCRGVDITNSFNSSINAEKKVKLMKKEDLISNRGSDIACLTDVARKKLDFSSVKFSHKQEFDVILEAKRHLSARLKNLNSVEAVASKKSPKTLERILSSPEHDFWPLSPRRDSQHCSGSAQMRFSPYNTSTRVMESSSQIPNGRERACLRPLRSSTEVASCDHNNYDGTLQKMDAKTNSPIPTSEKEAHDTDVSTTDNIKPNGEMNNVLQPELHVPEEVPSETKNTDITRTMQITGTIKSLKDDEIIVHSELDSLSENEAITSTMDDFPSTPSSIYQLDTADIIKYQEEHRSPISVLEPFFTEDANSPPSISLQNAGKRLQPRRLDFEDCSFESLPQDPLISANSCMEEDHLSQYVQLVLQASCLNWEQLSQIRSPPEELLHASLFDEVEFPPADYYYYYYDPKLLFDHINEVLLEIYKCHFCTPPWLAFTKPKVKPALLAELVLDEIMREADFYLLPTTERRTLDQLVSKDVASSRSWLDVRLDTEQTVVEISEDVLEESILDIVLEFYT